MNSTPIIDITALEKRFPRFALGPVNLSVPSGSIYGLIGPNGAGKSTLIDQIFGMGHPDAGCIRICGLDHSNDEVAMKQQVAYVGPDLSYAVWGRVGKAIRFMRGFRPTWDDAYAAHLMKALDLNLNDRIATLSFGGRTKLALLLALAWRPKVLVLDEPTTGLDAHSKKAIFTELLAIVRDESRTVLISSHQISDLERFADHIGILHQGRMLTSGATSSLVEKYVHVEFESDRVQAIQKLVGLTIQEHEEQRWRAVADTVNCPMSTLADAGARNVQAQALTLEELFLALTK